MSQKIFFLTIFTFLSNLAWCQLQVIQIEGRIRIDNKEYLKVGNNIVDNPFLQFSGTKNLIRAIDKDGKTYIFTPPVQSVIGAKALSSSDFLFFKKYEVKVQAKFSKSERLPDALKSSTKIIIANINKYLIDTARYKTNSSFFLQQSTTIQHTLAKKLNTIGDTLIIKYVDFLGLLPSGSPAKYALYCQIGKKKILVADNIIPFFDLSNQTGAMTASIIKFYHSREITQDSLFNNCFEQVYQAFGKPSPIDFRVLFNHYISKPDSGVKPRQHAVKGLIKLNGKNITRPNVNTPFNGGSIPFTLRQFVPSVGDQGTSGSCTAWATAYGARSINYNILHPGIKYAFSPEFVYNQLQPDYNKCIDGTTGIASVDAFTFMEYTGNLVKTDRSFNCQAMFTPNDDLAAAQYKIVSNHPLFGYSTATLTDADVAAVKQSLSQQKKPVAIDIFLPARKIINGITQYTSFDSLVYAPNTGIWQPSNNDYNELADRDTTHDSHAVCVVGYNDDVNGGSFEVLNSWGEGWGIKGYLWLNYEDFKRFAFNGYVIDNVALAPTNANNINTTQKKIASRRLIKQN